MGLDSSIYNNLLRAPKSIAEYDAEAMQGQTNRLALQMNQAKMADYQRGLQDESRLADVYRGATGADGTVDRNKLYSSAAQAGLGAKLPGMQKEHAALDETTTKTKGESLKNDETYIKNVNSKMGQARDMFNTIQTPQQAAQLVQGMYADPDLGKLFAMKGDTAEAAIARIPQDPAKFSEWVQAASLNAEKLASYRTPDANAKLQAKTSTDNNNADNAVQIRGQIQTAATAAAGRAQSAQQFSQRLAVDKGEMGPKGVKGGKAPAGYRWTAGGDLEPIPDGPAGNKATSSEGERKAATLLQRLEFSEKQLSAAVKADPGAAKPGLITNGLRAAGMEATANTLTSSERQRVDAAQLDILDAALTLGTGAAYTREQLEGYRKSYFPQLGDSKENVADKQARLKNVIDAAKTQAGRSAPKTSAKPATAGAYDDAEKERRYQEFKAKQGQK